MSKKGRSQATLFQAELDRALPLAARMRPRTLDEFVGQAQVLGPGKSLRAAIEKGVVDSIVLWGPPGSGKTTLGRLIASYTDREFVAFSAVTDGVARVREVVADAEDRLLAGRATILFVDEIHRLNKSQQDAFLPHVEAGTFTLVGATTENPSFEINGALLSRVRVFVLQPIPADAIRGLLARAVSDAERGLGRQDLTVADAALDLIATEADGDARRALTVLEAAAAHVGAKGTIDAGVAREAMQLRVARFDKGGEETFNMLSAFHKSLRGSDPQGALYWMARFVDGGGDPMILFRRAMAMAAEDIGLADPSALQHAVAARDAYHTLGVPEGLLPLTELVVYLATAPKSNSVVKALGSAMEAARQYPSEGVPMHIRNAPTNLMKELGYNAGYRYAHDSPNAYLPQAYLPDALRGTTFYTPGSFGFEKEIAKRLAWWNELKAKNPDGEAGE